MQPVPSDLTAEVIGLLRRSLQLGRRADAMNASTPLLGALPELDSMAVVSLLTAIEDEYGIAVADDEVSASTFASVGSLAGFLAEKLGQR